MNKRMEEHLEAWGNEKEMVPEFFSKGIDETLKSLPDVHNQVVVRPRKNRRAAKALVASAAVLTFGMIGSGFVSPSMAKVLAEIPIVGSIFADSSDSTLQLVEQKGLASTLNETVSHNGVSLTITEAFFGGGRLAIGYTITTDNGDIETLEKAGFPFSFKAKIDEKQFTYLADFEQSVKDGMIRGILDMSVGLESELSDNPTLQLNFSEIGGIKGSWNFNLPLNNKETVTATASFKPMVSTTWDEATFVVEKVEFTPGQSQIIIDRTMPREDMDNYSFAVYDEKGNSLGFEGGSGSSIIDKENGLVNFKDTLLLHGIEEAPEGIRVEVFNNHGKVWDASDVKEVTIPLNKAELPHTISYANGSELMVTGYEQLEDKTVVYYDIRGSLGLQNAFFMLQNEKGERYTTEKEAVRTDENKLSFKREFPKTTGSISLMTQVEKVLPEMKVIEFDLK